MSLAKQCGVMLAGIVVVVTCGGCPLASGLVPPPPQRQSEQVFAETTDGWMLAIRRYKPTTAKPNALPVILCHGFGVNGTFWTLEEYSDLADYLRNTGYDVWVLDLRGMGQSRRKPDFGRFVGAQIRTELPGGIDDWTVDHYALVDAPAVIRKVQKLTGAPKVCWIGHSMGGMVMYAYLIRGQNAQQNIQTFVAVSSPVFMFQPADKMLQEMKESVDLLKYVSVKGFSRGIAPIAALGVTPFDTLYYNRRNVTMLTIQRMYAYCMEDLPYGVAVQLNHMVIGGHFLSHDRKFDYSENLGKITIPMYFIGAKLDNMCPAGVAFRAYQSVGSRDKEFVHFSRANGQSADYGHCDLIWGNNARTEVFPKILAWLDKHQPGAASKPSTRPATQPGSQPASLQRQ